MRLQRYWICLLLAMLMVALLPVAAAAQRVSAAGAAGQEPARPRAASDAAAQEVVAIRVAGELTLEQLQAMKADGRLHDALLPMAELLPQFPAVFIADGEVRQVRQGRDFTVSAFRANGGSEHVKAIGPDGSLVAIGRIALPHVYHPVVVFTS